MYLSLGIKICESPTLHIPINFFLCIFFPFHSTYHSLRLFYICLLLHMYFVYHCILNKEKHYSPAAHQKLSGQIWSLGRTKFNVFIQHVSLVHNDSQVMLSNFFLKPHTFIACVLKCRESSLSQVSCSRLHSDIQKNTHRNLLLVLIKYIIHCYTLYTVSPT